MIIQLEKIAEGVYALPMLPPPSFGLVSTPTNVIRTADRIPFFNKPEIDLEVARGNQTNVSYSRADVWGEDDDWAPHRIPAGSFRDADARELMTLLAGIDRLSVCADYRSGRIGSIYVSLRLTEDDFSRPAYEALPSLPDSLVWVAAAESTNVDHWELARITKGRLFDNTHVQIRGFEVGPHQPWIPASSPVQDEDGVIRCRIVLLTDREQAIQANPCLAAFQVGDYVSESNTPLGFGEYAVNGSAFTLVEAPASTVNRSRAEHLSVRTDGRLMASGHFSGFILTQTLRPIPGNYFEFEDRDGQATAVVLHEDRDRFFMALTIASRRYTGIEGLRKFRVCECGTGTPHLGGHFVLVSEATNLPRKQIDRAARAQLIQRYRQSFDPSGRQELPKNLTEDTLALAERIHMGLNDGTYTRHESTGALNAFNRLLPGLGCYGVRALTLRCPFTGIRVVPTACDPTADRRALREALANYLRATAEHENALEDPRVWSLLDQARPE